MNPSNDLFYFIYYYYFLRGGRGGGVTTEQVAERRSYKQPNKGIYQPDEPENHRKERKEGKGARAKEKRLATVFSFYSVDFGDIFLNDKKPMLKVTRRPFLRATRFS